MEEGLDFMYLVFMSNLVMNGCLFYMVIVFNILIINVFRKILFLLKILKILLLSFVVFDFGVGLMV